MSATAWNSNDRLAAIDAAVSPALEKAVTWQEQFAIVRGDEIVIADVLERGGQVPATIIPIAEERERRGAPPSLDIPYRTALQIGAQTPETPAWIMRGIAALQAITELDGKIKSSGKTTLVTHMVAAVLDGRPFLGPPTMKTKVCYITEQTAATFREALERAGLMGRGDELRVVFRREVAHLAWPALVQTIAEDARRDGYGLLVIDTLAKLAGIVNENDSGECAQAMVPLRDAAHDGLAIIVCRHDRKSGGEVGESGRGSSAISGDVDVILQLRRPEGNQPSSRRVIESLSRYSETPEKVVIELTEDGYLLLGDEEAVTLADALRKVSAHLGGTVRAERNGEPGGAGQRARHDAGCHSARAQGAGVPRRSHPFR